MSDALRVLFAELGFKVDDKALDAANRVVDRAIAGVRKLVGATEGSDAAEAALAARRTARAALRHRQLVQAQADDEKLHGKGGQAREATYFDKLRELSAADTKAREDAAADARDAEATRAARRLLGPTPAERDAHAKERFTPFGDNAKQGKLAFGGKLGADKWKELDEARKPVSGYMDLLGRMEKASSEAIGKSVQPALAGLAKQFPALGAGIEKMGLGELSAANAGRLLAGSTLAVVAVLHHAVTAALEFSSAFAQQAEQLRETSREARITATELQELQHAAVISGVGADRMTSSVTALGQRLRDADLHMGGSGVGGTLRRLGISMRDASGQVRPTTDVLADLAVAMEQIQSPRRRVRIVEQLGMDRRMLDVLHTGEGGIVALRRELAELGGGVTPEAQRAARAFTQEQHRLGVAMDSVRSVIFVGLAPAIGSLIQLATWATATWARLTRGTHLMKIAVTAFKVVAVAAGAAITAAWLPAMLPWLLIAGAVAGLIIIVDDLWTTLDGGESVTRDVIDGLFGVGATAEAIETVNRAWESFDGWVESILNRLNQLPQAAQVAFDTLVPFARLRHLVPDTSGNAAGGAEEAAGGEAAPARGARRTEAPAAPAGAVQLGFDGQPVRGRAPARTAASVPASSSTRAVPQAIGLRAVAAPATAAAAVPKVTQITRTQHNQFNFTGPDAQQMAAKVQVILERQQRAQNDADHPTEANGG